MIPPNRDLLDETLHSEEWRNQTNVAIAKHLGIATETVRLRRHHLQLIPDTVERANGRTMRLGRVGKSGGKPLTAKQQARIAMMIPFAERISKKKAKSGILDEDELLSVAHDALLVAVRYWKPRRQKGPPKAPGSKWQAYAVNGVMRAFHRAFKTERKRLRKLALFGDHPYQKWVLGERLRSGLKVARGESTSREGRDGGYADEIPDPIELETMMEKFRALSGGDQNIITVIAGLHGKPAWSIAKLAEFWHCSMTEAEDMVEQAKNALKG